MTRRQAIWLFTMLERERGEVIAAPIGQEGEIDWDEMRTRIHDVLDQSNGRYLSLQRGVAEILPDADVLWITTDAEQLQWLLKAIRGEARQKGRVGALTRLPLEPKDELLAELDLWETHRDTKRDLIEKLRDGWVASNKRHRTLRWFDDDEYEKCDLLWAWLHKNRPSLVEGRRSFEFRVHVEHFFNDAGLRADEINYIINTVKTRWSQRKYRETNKDKKQFNFVLSKSADRALDKLASARGVSRSQLLDLLIHEEKDRGQAKSKG
ncbi:hypothetical protein CAL15_13175 [Bordetella genomosp. 13]|uniref:Uncharacterized protein n=2 Tax=Bordetella genomosp. 13 TaxID=463040 RepID=A0A1W6ZCZ6_9BORD|nr:hypothetical protein CAL15_13175 [Bordetella genomosp. 13]